MFLRICLHSESGESGILPVIDNAYSSEQWATKVMLSGGIENFFEKLYESDIPDKYLDDLLADLYADMYPGMYADMYGM